jgi:hypothetical protein
MTEGLLARKSFNFSLPGRDAHQTPRMSRESFFTCCVVIDQDVPVISGLCAIDGFRIPRSPLPFFVDRFKSNQITSLP